MGGWVGRGIVHMLPYCCLFWLLFECCLCSLCGSSHTFLNLCEWGKAKWAFFWLCFSSHTYGIFQVFSQFPDIKDKVSLHLVEISPALSQIQSERLTDSTKATDLSDCSETKDGEGLGPYRQETTKYGAQVSWYRTLEDVPKGLSIYLAHEFLDALPVHKFQVQWWWWWWCPFL